MKFLFTAPRFHTNQLPIVKGLIEKGHEVRYFVVFVGATEDHSDCEPLVLVPSRTTVWEKKRLEKKMIPSDVESAIGGQFIPDYPFLKRAFEEYMPDVVICREKTNLTLCVKALCDTYHIPCVLYDQEPLYQPKEPMILHTAQIRNNSILKRIKIKLERTMNSDLRMLQKMRNTSGFPSVRMTPVKYRRLPKELSKEQSDEDAFFVPFVAAYHKEKGCRNYCPDGEIRILCVGKFREHKRMDLLVDAVASLVDVQWSLTIVGQAVSSDEKEYYAKIEKMIKVNGLEGRITLIPGVPHKEVGALYAAHDLFILPTRREYANIAILEAMSYGMAIITTNNNGTASYVEDAKCGMTFETENVESLYKSINKVIEIGVKKLGVQAHKGALELFNFDNYYSALWNMLNNEFGIIMNHSLKSI